MLAEGIEVFDASQDLLSILLQCSGLTKIQKAVSDQMDNRPPNSDYEIFLVQV